MARSALTPSLNPYKFNFARISFFGMGEEALMYYKTILLKKTIGIIIKL